MVAAPSRAVGPVAPAELAPAGAATEAEAEADVAVMPAVGSLGVDALTSVSSGR